MSPDLLRRTEIKLKSGAQCGSAPRDPPRNGQAGSDSRQRYCAQRRKFPCSGQKPVCSASRAARFRLSLPLEGKVPEGRMRCRLRVAEPFTNEKVTLCCVTRFALHLITACGRSCLAAARAGLALDLPRRSIHYQAPASQPSRGSQSWRELSVGNLKSTVSLPFKGNPK